MRTEMKMTRALTLACLVALAGPGLAQEPEDVAAQASNAFAFDLYGRIRGLEGNLFCSPYSISVALAMTRTGARGATATQMDTVLHLPATTSASRAHQALAQALQAPMVSEDGSARGAQVPAYEIHIASTLWGQEGVTFLDPFLSIVREGYGAPLQRIDFTDTAAARARINGWVEEQTRQKIKNIVPEGLPLPDTKLALANAIYFKAAWQDAFQEGATKEAEFQVKPDRKVEVPMMRRFDRAACSATDDLLILELPYVGNSVSMVFLLPRAADGLAALEAKLTADAVEEWLEALRFASVDMQIPRFQFTTPLDLTDILPEMGMADAFDLDLADFSGMTGGRDLYIGSVLHKAFVAVDEKGTEAAAATVVMMRPTSGLPSEPVRFVADHPFLFLIRHRDTGCILFAGRVEDPSQH